MRIYINKKLAFLVLICFFVLFMGQKAKKEKGKSIISADTGFGIIYDVKIIDETLETSFVSDPILKFHVPPSPKSFTLLFKCWTTFVYAWSDYEGKRAECKICLRILSDMIPYSMDVWTAVSILQEFGLGNFLNSKTKSQRIEYFTEILMRRDGATNLSVNYKSGEQVPERKVIRIFSELLEKDFDVEVWVEGVVQGMKAASYRNAAIEVSRLSH